MEKFRLILFIFTISVLLSLCTKEQDNSLVPQKFELNHSQQNFILNANNIGYDIFRLINSNQDNYAIAPMGMLMENLVSRFAIRLEKKSSNVTNSEKKAFDKITKQYEDIMELLAKLDNQCYFNSDIEIGMAKANSRLDAFKELAKGKSCIKISETSTYNGEDTYNIINFVKFNFQFSSRFSMVESPFYVNPDQSKFIKMLCIHSVLNYYFDEDFKAVEIPLSKRNYQMILLLPDNKESVNNIKKRLNSDMINSIRKKFISKEMLAYIPLINMNSYIGKKIIQNDKGIAKLESYHLITKNKISQLNDNDLNFHHVQMMFNEKELKEFQYHGNNNDIFDLFFDRPFFFIIYEKFTKAIIVLGQINNPEKKVNI